MRIYRSLLFWRLSESDIKHVSPKQKKEKSKVTFRYSHFTLITQWKMSIVWFVFKRNVWFSSWTCLTRRRKKNFGIAGGLSTAGGFGISLILKGISAGICRRESSVKSHSIWEEYRRHCIQEVNTRQYGKNVAFFLIFKFLESFPF